MSTIYFCLFAVVALLSAFGAVASKTPIRAALSLLAHILALAGIYISLYAHLLGAVQLIVYAGAVVVLFVFVIMLIGPTEDTAAQMKGGDVGRVLSVCLMIGVTLSIAAAVGGVNPVAPAIAGCEGGVAECSQFGGVRGLANVLYKDAAVPFELISILLLVAILGAMAVARGRSIHEGKRRKAARDELAAQVAASSGQ
ncbi:MAG: NADH-ubiquinone oxidoreductase chain [Myxococcaceae bacterium]|nr:NADH-ubiquinone oxidoreductase chain [Myxococcaceae bacterium]